MAGYDSKYSGAQVEALLDQVASGNAGGGGGGGIAVETDPIFLASPAAGITEKQISDWEGMAEALNLLDEDVAALTDEVAGKQEELISGINIKTINGASILGSGNITIEGGSGGGSTTTKPYVLQAVALSELEALGVGEHTLDSRDYQKAGEDLTALQDAAIGDGLVALEYPYDESAMGYIFPTSVRLGSEEYGAEVQFYLNGATFTLYYPTAPSEVYSDITVSVLRQGEKEVVRVDNGGGFINSISDMRPNVVYAPVLCTQVHISNFLPAQVTENREHAYDEFTAILDLENTIDGDPPYLAIGEEIKWANGEMPALTEGLWELNIVRFTEWMGDENYIEYLGVLTPFKFEE